MAVVVVGSGCGVDGVSAIAQEVDVSGDDFGHLFEVVCCFVDIKRVLGVVLVNMSKVMRGGELFGDGRCMGGGGGSC